MIKIAQVVPLVVGLLLPAPGRAADPTLPQDVRAALEKNARALTDLAIDGTRGRRLFGPASKTLAALGTLESEAEFTQPVRFELQIQGVKLHESLRYPRGDYKSGTGVDERSYDGAGYYGGSIDPSKPATPGNLVIRGPASLEPLEIDFFLWYLFAAGFAGPVRGSEVGRSIESLVLERAASNRIGSVKDVGMKRLEVVVEYPEPWASPATVPAEKDAFIKDFKGDSRHLQLRIEGERRQQAGHQRRCRFLLDGSIGYAVREMWESRAEGDALMFHTTNSDFRQVEPGGVWLPWRSEVVSHAY